MPQNKVDVLLGLQWGDEGKGKVVDVLTPRYDIVARFQGGRTPDTPSNSKARNMCYAPSPRESSSTDRPTS